MQLQVSFLFLGLTVATVFCAPIQSATWTIPLSNNYQHSTVNSPQRQYLQLAAYQDVYSPYLLYNVVRVQTDLNAEPAAVLANGKPTIAHVPNYNYYYGTPVYDFRFPLNPVYTVLRPNLPPRPPLRPPTTQRPSPEFDDDDGIEKLDMKLDSQTEMKKPEENAEASEMEDDSITVDSI